MASKTPRTDARAWWQTSIIDMAPGKIEFRGQPIQTIIGEKSFAQMIWFMALGSDLSTDEAALFEAALVAGVDHGPQAPSIAAARMAASCGVGLNNAMASAVNMLGDVHGGAGEQCAELYYNIHTRIDAGEGLEHAVDAGLAQWRENHGKIVSGFGHRFHVPTDPRAPRLMHLVRQAAKTGSVRDTFVQIGEAIEQRLSTTKPIPMNIDGATAVIFCTLGAPAPLARGFFCLSRSVGILAHVWEQMGEGRRNKGPMPPEFLPLYIGQSART